MLFIIAPIVGYIIMFIWLCYIDCWEFHFSNLFLSLLGAAIGFAAAMLCGFPVFCCAERVVEKTEEQPIYVMYQVKDAEDNILGNIYLEEESGNNYKYVTYKEDYGYEIALTEGGNCSTEKTSEAPYVTIYTRNFKSNIWKWLLGNNYTYEYVFHLPDPVENISDPMI